MARSVFLGAGSDQSLNTTDSPTFAGLTVTGRAPLPRQATLSRTHAQILSLEVDEPTIIAAPGAGKLVVVVGGVVHFQFDNNPGYTNVTGDTRIILRYVSSGNASADISGDALANATIQTLPFLGFGFHQATADLFIASNSLNDFTNLAVTVTVTGPAPSGGGDASNIMRVSVLYHVLNLTTGLYE